MNKKNLFYIIITGIVAVTLIWLSQNNKVSENKFEAEQEENFTEKQGLQNLEGILWASDNKDKGDLMLVNNYSTIYIKTARDFSSLIGKNVIISFNGTLDNFTLLNIEESLSKDGFIKAQ